MNFFESTPIGRIINRFNKDLQFTELKIPDTFKSFLRLFFNFLSSIAVISINNPYFLIALVPIAIVYYFVQVKYCQIFKIERYLNKKNISNFFKRVYAKFSRQIKRLESVSRSPIFSRKLIVQ